MQSADYDERRRSVKTKFKIQSWSWNKFRFSTNLTSNSFKILIFPYSSLSIVWVSSLGERKNHYSISTELCQQTRQFIDILLAFFRRIEYVFRWTKFNYSMMQYTVFLTSYCRLIKKTLSLFKLFSKTVLIKTLRLIYVMV